MKAAEVVFVFDPVVGLAAESVLEPVESAEHVASLPTMTDSAPSSSYTGSHSCTSVVTASVEPQWVVVGAAQQQHPVVDQEASANAKSAEYLH